MLDANNKTLVVRVGDRFAAMLRDELGAENFATVCERNRTAVPGVCHSHDFCDANMTMDAAIREVCDLPEDWHDCASESQAAFWNAAWDHARTKQLS